MIDTLTLLILTVATWRLSSLLVNEGGPFDLFARFRLLVAGLTDLFTCIWCLSLWVGLSFTLLYWYFPIITFWIALPFALSGGAIAWDKHNG